METIPSIAVGQVLALFLLGVAVGVHLQGVRKRPESLPIAVTCSALAFTTAESMLHFSATLRLVAILVAIVAALWGLYLLLPSRGSDRAHHGNAT